MSFTNLHTEHFLRVNCCIPAGTCLKCLAKFYTGTTASSESLLLLFTVTMSVQELLRWHTEPPLKL